MDTWEETSFSTMLTNEYLIPNFVHPLSKYNAYYFNKNMEKTDKNALLASIIFDANSVKIPFQYKLTDEQFKLYSDCKHDVIDTIVWYLFDNCDCKYLVETYGVFNIIKKVYAEYGIEHTERIYKDNNINELYCCYTYYILLEYFDNIVYLSLNKDNIATDKDIENLEKIINDIAKINYHNLLI